MLQTSFTIPHTDLGPRKLVVLSFQHHGAFSKSRGSKALPTAPYPAFEDEFTIYKKICDM